MAGRIPQSFIDELLSRVDIVDVVDSRVPLRKAGKDYTARCPFHEEKSPSFTVSQTKQFYHCFGCGAHGTAISFLMEYEHLSFIEALKELARQTGLELPQIKEQNRGEQQSLEEMYSLMQESAQFYRLQLRDHPQAAEAIEYLKARGLNSDIAAEFGIGYAPPGWDNLSQRLATNPQRQELLVKTGMLIRNEKQRCYDRFRDRIMFPIRDRRGRVIGFGGRVLDRPAGSAASPAQEEKRGPKYLNSPESPLFHKGYELYGLYEARQARRQIDRLLVVEGYMDVVALAQHGVRNAVATLGTAITINHLQPIFRTTNEVIFCFDGDRAGRAAAWKALDIVLPEIHDNRQARFLFLPDGEDPDTLIRKEGTEAFLGRIRQATPLSNFLLEGLAQEVDLSTIDGRTRLVELARTKLTKIQNRLYRHMLIEELAQYSRIPVQTLLGMLGEQAATTAPSRKTQIAKPQKLSLVRSAITLLLNQPQLAQLAGSPQRFASIQEPGINILIELLELLQTNPHITCAMLLEHWRDRAEGPYLAKLARTPLVAGEQTQVFEDVLTRIEKLGREQALQQLLLKSKTTRLSETEKGRLKELLAEKALFNQQKSTKT